MGRRLACQKGLLSQALDRRQVDPRYHPASPRRPKMDLQEDGAVDRLSGSVSIQGLAMLTLISIIGILAAAALIFFSALFVDAGDDWNRN